MNFQKERIKLFLSGMIPKQQVNGSGKLTLITDEGPPFAEKRIEDNEAYPLNKNDSVGSNETFTSNCR